MATQIEELFYKSLLVTIKSADREERKGRIHIAVEVHVITTPVHRKELVVRLTDEKDLFFLYTLKLAEDDFQVLKTQQGLLVDFGAFPQKFIQLLELCQTEESHDIPKFILELVATGAGGIGTSATNLNVIETNPFKHLTHLALKFLPGSDADVKKYLADCLKQLKDQNSNLMMKLEHTDADLSQQLRQAREALSSRTTELDSLRAEWNSKANRLSVQHAQEVTAEREKALQAQGAQQQQYDRERRESEQAHSRAIKQLESRVIELEAANKDLTDKKYRSEASIRELKTKLSSLEEEHQRSKQELTTLRRDNATLDADYHEQEKLVNQLRTRLAVSEQEVKDKEQVLAKSSDLLGTEQANKKRYEEEIEKKARHLSKLESTVKTMSEELIKANEIIKKLQGEVKNYHGKLKLRSTVVTEQEKLLGEKNKELETIREEVKKVKDTLQQKDEECKKLNSTLEATLQKLEESKQLLKTNENVINWLNKQVTETQLNQNKYTGTHGPFELNSTGASSHTYKSAPPLHNYSGPHGLPQSSRLSAASHNLSGPRSVHSQQQHQASARPQVHYNPVMPTKSGIPVPSTTSSPLGGTVSPRDDPRASPILAPSKAPPHSGAGDGFLDAKYLQQTDDKPSRLPPRTSPTSIHFTDTSPTQQAASRPIQSVRISRDVVAPRSAPAKQQAPLLASAYFPQSHGQGRVT